MKHIKGKYIKVKRITHLDSGPGKRDTPYCDEPSGNVITTDDPNLVGCQECKIKYSNRKTISGKIKPWDRSDLKCLKCLAIFEIDEKPEPCDKIKCPYCGNVSVW